MPHELWSVLHESFPGTSFDIHLIGPQVNAAAHLILARNPDGPQNTSIQAWKMPFEQFRETCRENENELDVQVKPDLVVLFNPGLGHHAQGKDWTNGFASIAELRVPILITSFDAVDHEGDLQVVESCLGEGAKWLHKFEDNPFKCLKHEVHNRDHGRVINTNAFASLVEAN
jgi:hypothetical protein